MRIEAKLEDFGLVLPEPMQVPSGLWLPFAWVRVRGNWSYISGHIALNPDGSVAQPLGEVGA
jgi:enamine deaminase RidA (YjgF/YER057c/UK114 family)